VIRVHRIQSHTLKASLSVPPRQSRAAPYGVARTDLLSVSNPGHGYPCGWAERRWVPCLRLR